MNGDQLHGIPFSDDGKGRWYPGFNIPNGTVLVDEAGGRYLVKMLEGEQKMNAVADASALITAQGFDLNVTLAKPDPGYVDPAIGARPTVTEPPVFIDGILQ